MRILLLDYGDPIMGFVREALKASLHELGFCETQKQSGSEILAYVEHFHPDLCLTHNFYIFDAHPDAAQIEEFFLSKKIPVATWFFEAPHASGSIQFSNRWRQGELPHDFLYFCPDSSIAEMFREKGLEARHLPLAVSSALLAQGDVECELREKFKSPLTYIGTSIDQWESIAEPTEHEIRRFHVGAFRADFWSLCRQIVRNQPVALNFFEELDAKTCEDLALFFDGLYSSVAEYLEAREKLRVRFWKNVPPFFAQIFELFCGRLDWIYSYSSVAISLNRLRDLGLHVYGGDSWKYCLQDYDRPTPRLSDAELLAAYRYSDIIFCATKAPFRKFVHDRPLAVLAVGGFPLTDYREDLDRMFEKDEIATYSSLENAKELIRHYQKHPDERAKISKKGRERIANEHTYDERSARIVKLACEHFGLA